LKSSKEFWDKTAPRYAKRPVRDEGIYQRKLAITREYLRPDSSVLEFGCGTGSTAIVHAPHVRHILATDLSDGMLDIAEAKAREAGVENIRFQQGTLDSLDLDTQSFDVVLGLNILHLLENATGAVSKVHDLLRPGGVFISSTVLIGDIKLLWRLLIPVLQFAGFAPYVNRFDRQKLLDMLTTTGFTIDHEWQPEKGSIFIVARKCNGIILQDRVAEIARDQLDEAVK
jgi:ubiquinone/menaquinone biosynthesis C-methylase UbiE